MKKPIKSKFTFKHNHEDSLHITVSTTGVQIDEITDAFEQFLRGCGFHFEGTIGVIPPYDSDEN